MYNNEQVWKFLGRISAETCQKMGYFGSQSPKIAKRWGLRPQTPTPCLRRPGASPPDPCSSYMTRRCARPYTHWNYWLTQMLGKFGDKTNLTFYIFCPPPLFKKRSRATVYYTFFIRTRGSFFAQNLRTIPASEEEEQSLKFW